ncbi:thioesterase domain-containing protein [Streptomyces canus]
MTRAGGLTVSRALVCLPFAGGGAGFYRGWTEVPDAGPRITPFQLPGREELFAEEPYDDVVTAAEQLAPRIVSSTAEYDGFALFGHSLGAVLAYEAVKALARLDAPAPEHLFVSGSPGPRSGRTDRATGLGDDEFLARVEQFAGYRHEALDDPELREILLPLLRADVEMHENYKPRSDEPITVPVTALRGSDDTLVGADQAREWSGVTTAAFHYVEIPGRHMYLVDAARPLLESITRTLAG